MTHLPCVPKGLRDSSRNTILVSHSSRPKPGEYHGEIKCLDAVLSVKWYTSPQSHEGHCEVLMTGVNPSGAVSGWTFWPEPFGKGQGVLCVSLDSETKNRIDIRGVYLEKLAYEVELDGFRCYFRFKQPGPSRSLFLARVPQSK